MDFLRSESSADTDATCPGTHKKTRDHDDTPLWREPGKSPSRRREIERKLPFPTPLKLRVAPLRHEWEPLSEREKRKSISSMALRRGSHQYCSAPFFETNHATYEGEVCVVN